VNGRGVCGAEPGADDPDMETKLGDLDLLLTAARALRDQLEVEAADLVLACRVRLAPDPAWHPADGFEHVVAVLYAPTGVLARIEDDADLRGRIRQALDAVQPQSVCVDGVEVRPAGELVSLAERLRRAASPVALDPAA
jgi:hypothetical protein